jgi:dolichol kinase
MTYFLLSLFLGFLVFPRDVPYLPLAFSTVGDLGGKLLGMRFGSTPLFRDKTLQGTLAFTAGSLLAGWILQRLLDLPLAFVLAGAPFAAVVELFSSRLDDNFSVLLISGGFLAALRYFFGA